LNTGLNKIYKMCRYSCRTVTNKKPPSLLEQARRQQKGTFQLNSEFTTQGLKNQLPPRVGPPPRNPFAAQEDDSPRQILAALDVLSRRQQASRARLSSITRLRGEA